MSYRSGEIFVRWSNAGFVVLQISNSRRDDFPPAASNALQRISQL